MTLIPDDCLCNCLCSDCSSSENSGVVLGGSADVCDNVQAYPDMAVWPLDEDGSPYLDRSLRMWDGTTENAPVQVAGVYCQWAAQFLGREFIELEQDNLSEDNAFSVSLWASVQSYYAQRQWFSRGNPYVFSLGHSVMNTVWAQVIVPTDSGDEVFSCFGDTILTQGKWYHISCVFVPGQSLKLYINGILDGEEPVTAYRTIDKTGGNMIGGNNEGGFPESTLQEVRLHLRERSADWLLAEVANFCNPLFYTVDPTVDTAIFD